MTRTGAGVETVETGVEVEEYDGGEAIRPLVSLFLKAEPYSEESARSLIQLYNELRSQQVGSDCYKT